MNDQVSDTRTIPTWFWIAAGAALLFEGFGCFTYLAEVTANHANMPLDERVIWDATPMWMVAAYAIAVWVGLIGGVLLLLRRKLAVPVLFVSLVAAIVQFGGVFFVPQLRQTVPDSALTVPIGIIVACYLIFMLARLADKRGWLR